MSGPQGSLDGYAKGPSAVDWEDRYDMARLRRDRVAAAQRELTAAGVDALMVWKDENVRYPNMVFAVEPLVWVPGVEGGGGVRIEDMVLVTEGEPRVLSRVEYEERLLL